jgi:hypothetical protein
LHPARQLLDELTARSLWFASESALGFAHFIAVAEVAANQLAGAGAASAHMFAQVLQFVREQWPPEGRMSHIAALGQQAEAEQSTRPGLMSSALGLLDGQIVGSIERIKPDALQLASCLGYDTAVIAELFPAIPAALHAAMNDTTHGHP